jgi:hypothetical protein
LNRNGIYTVRFYIRGKPWLVTVDDIFLFKNLNEPKLYFSKVNSDNSMWSAIVEKAWAKMKGSYTSADTGFNVNGLRALTGSPVFTYKTKEITDAHESWLQLKEADENNYLMTSATIDPNADTDQNVNECGIANNHAFSILSVFSINDDTFLYAIRNPWSFTKYDGEWSDQDTENWTEENIAQVPLLDINPLTSSDDLGIFFMEETMFLSCF